MVDKLSSEVEIFLSCRKLPRLDYLSQSDPMVVLYMIDTKTGRPLEIGKTEYMKDTPDPDFKRTFTIEYKFEEDQQLLFEVYDVDATNINNLSKHDFVGQTIIALGELVAAPGCTLTEGLKKKTGQKSRGYLVLHCKELQNNKEFIEFKVGAKDLPKMDGLFGKSDPYLEIYKPSPSGHMVCEHKTEVIKSNLNPTWAPFRLPVSKLCGGNLEQELEFKVWDWDSSSKPDFIGSFKVSVAALLDGDTKKGASPFQNLPLTDPKKKGKSRGSMLMYSVVRTREVGFLDYIAGGMQVGLMVAIDFTGSNGDPRDPRSLHYRFGSTLNAYQQAITSIGNIVAHYDTDQKFPVWGFGGSIRGQTSHCFPLTFNNAHIEVPGVQGILDAYNNAFNHVLLSGPTYFSEVINVAASIASTPYQPNSQHYSILLIITDGVINDMGKTIDAIVRASHLPLSIIVVGVGSSDFSKMEELDADDKKLRSPSTSEMAVRDIVQFVPMRKFANMHPSALPKETLFEVPGQLISHMKRNKIAPMPPRAALVPDFSRMPTEADFANNAAPSEQALGVMGAAIYSQSVGASPTKHAGPAQPIPNAQPGPAAAPGPGQQGLPVAQAVQFAGYGGQQPGEPGGAI